MRVKSSLCPDADVSPLMFLFPGDVIFTGRSNPEAGPSFDLSRARGRLQGFLAYKNPPLGTYSWTVPGVLWWSKGGGLLMSEVPL